MLLFAWKSLLRERVRLLITLSGVALAVVLILVMNGLFAGAARQITLYIDRSGADLFVAQSGVRNMHMATSVLPAVVAAEVRAVPGVERVEAITYFPATLEWEGVSDMLYVIGLDSGAVLGGPWAMAEGNPVPPPGHVVVSDRQRPDRPIRVGDQVRVGGRTFAVSGLSRDTKSLASSLVFLNNEDAAAMRGGGRVNYLLVRTEPGREASDVVDAIGGRLSGVTPVTRAEMSDGDRALSMQMGIELLGIMAAVGFLIGLAVVALTIYIATVEQLRHYSVLKAVGAGPAHLLTAVFGQGLAAAVGGYAAGVGLSYAVGAMVPRWAPGLEIDLVPGYLLKVFGLVLVMGALASLPPFWRVLRLDPVDVFRP